MLVAETVLGNVDDDPEWAAKYEARPESEIERVVLDERERRRSRIRTTTDAGTEIGIVVESDHALSPGDVLVDGDRLVVVTFENREALAISFDGTGPSTGTLVAMTDVGYQVGNRHWDLAVRDEEILVALGADSERKVREVEAALPATARTRRELVDPTLFDGTPGHGDADGHGHADASGGQPVDHSHTHGAHEHDGGHTHDAHEHDGNHTHDHSTEDRGSSPDGTRGAE